MVTSAPTTPKKTLSRRFYKASRLVLSCQLRNPMLPSSPLLSIGGSIKSFREEPSNAALISRPLFSSPREKIWARFPSEPPRKSKRAELYLPHLGYCHLEHHIQPRSCLPDRDSRCYQCLLYSTNCLQFDFCLALISEESERAV